jgi:hypothetical protein
MVSLNSSLAACLLVGMAFFASATPGTEPSQGGPPGDVCFAAQATKHSIVGKPASQSSSEPTPDRGDASAVQNQGSTSRSTLKTTPSEGSGATPANGAQTPGKTQDSESWRMVFKDGFWWYWTRQNAWLIWTGTQWVSYPPAAPRRFAAPYVGSWPIDNGFSSRGYYYNRRSYGSSLNQPYLGRSYDGGFGDPRSGMFSNPNMPQPGTGYSMPSQTGGPGGD